MLAVIVSACSQLTSSSSVTPPARPSILDQIRAVDLTPRFTQAVPIRSTSGTSQIRAATYYGDETLLAGKPARSGTLATDDTADPTATGALSDKASPRSADQGFEMNFENAAVSVVAKAILGDILGVGYTIDPRVQGTINLSSGRAVPKKDLLYVFESALRAAGIALVRDGRGYRLVPSADAIGTGVIDRSEGTEAGYGIQ